jgi:hypothetical protein
MFENIRLALKMFQAQAKEMKGITRCKMTIKSESAVCKKFLGQIVSYLASL